MADRLPLPVPPGYALDAVTDETPPREPTSETERPPPPPGSWLRKNDGLEFDRIIFFTDAVFAIALTLLVVELGVPVITQDPEVPARMLDALDDKLPQFISFFIAFILIARYWVAHHMMFAQLRAIDPRLISINLVYLAFVAFLPFPTALVGEYEENPISVMLFAVCLAIISGLEVVQFRHAYRADLTRKPMPPEVYRWGVIGSSSPVVVFIVTMPLAFISSTLCLTSWLVTIPIGAYLAHKAPVDVNEYLIAGRPRKAKRKQQNGDG